MAARRPFWKWQCWKSIGFCLWPPSTCIWNWNSKANLTYAPETMSSTDRRTDGRTDKVNPVYAPSNFVGRGYNKAQQNCECVPILCTYTPSHQCLTYWPLGDWNEILDQVTFKLNLVTDGWGNSCKIALRWLSLEFIDDKSTLVQVMAWCHQATSH